MGKLTKNDYKFFDMARRVAEQSDYKSCHVGCVIVYQGRVITSASNSNKTHPVQKKYNRKYRNFKKTDKPILDKLHSEINALVQIPKCIENNIDYSKCKVYVYRISVGKRLQIGLARPCPSCMEALRDKGVRKIYYTTDDGFAAEELY